MHGDVLSLARLGFFPSIELTCHHLAPFLEIDVVVVVKRSFLPLQIPGVLLEPHFEGLLLQIFPVRFSLFLVLLELVLIRQPQLNVEILPLVPVALAPLLEREYPSPDLAPHCMLKVNDLVALLQISIFPLSEFRSQSFDLQLGPTQSFSERTYFFWKM